jgi:hypothetical protein
VGGLPSSCCAPLQVRSPGLANQFPGYPLELLVFMISHF